MKVDKVRVSRGRKLNKGNYESENFEVALEATLGEADDPRETINSLERVLSQHLNAWERQQRGEDLAEPEHPPTQVFTADQLVQSNEGWRDEQPPAERATTAPPTTDQLRNTHTPSPPPPEQTREDTDAGEEEPLVCPKCNEVMTQRSGKGYYMCSNHWGYPDMIRKGVVKDKRF